MAKTPTGGTSWNQLYVNGRIKTLARYPNREDGYALTGEIVHGRGLLEPEPVAGGSFRYTDPRPERWQSLENVWMHGNWFFDWADAAVRIAELDSPGEWYLDAGRGLLHYFPDGCRVSASA